MKPKAIVCDVDGCLLDVSKLYKQIFIRKLSGQMMWNYFHENANNPEYVAKIEPVFNLVNMYDQEFYKIIILTARRDLIAKSTLHHLLEGDIRLNNISMYIFRQEKDEGVPSHIYKLAELNKLKEQFDIECIIDDEFQNCAHFKDAGFNVLRVLRNQIDGGINEF